MKGVIYGVGDSTGAPRDHHAYNQWKNMMMRCYSPSYQKKKPSYIGCTVCEEWLKYSVFFEWYNIHYREGFQLDKDLLVSGNKVYSPDTCAYVPKRINLLFATHKASRSGSIGVFPSPNGRYFVMCSTERNGNHHGTYDTVSEAESVYKRVKEGEVRFQATQHKDELDRVIFNYLMTWEVTTDV